MNKERFSLAMIDAMSEEMMRQILKNQELEHMRADEEARRAAHQAEQERLEKEANDKYLEAYFQEKFANQHPKYHDQF